MSRILSAAAVLTSLVALPASPAAAQMQWPSLGELVAKAGLEPGTLLQLDQRVTSYSMLHKPRLFVLAGYLLDEAPGSGLGPLHVWQYDADTGEWTHAAHDHPGRGSVLAVNRVGRFLLLGCHRSPSATTDFVLTRDLRIHDDLAGRFEAALDDRRIVLLRAQTHFAPTYETLLDVYDLERRQGFPLFPPTPPSPFRRRLIDAAAETYADAGEAWCNVNNHHCDASMLDCNCSLFLTQIYKSRSDGFSDHLTIERFEGAPNLVRVIRYYGIWNREPTRLRQDKLK